jgi:hypothetical protein
MRTQTHHSLHRSINKFHPHEVGVSFFYPKKIANFEGEPELRHASDLRLYKKACCSAKGLLTNTNSDWICPKCFRMQICQGIYEGLRLAVWSSCNRVASIKRHSESTRWWFDLERWREKQISVGKLERDKRAVYIRSFLKGNGKPCGASGGMRHCEPVAQRAGQH